MEDQNWTHSHLTQAAYGGVKRKRKEVVHELFKGFGERSDLLLLQTQTEQDSHCNAESEWLGCGVNVHRPGLGAPLSNFSLDDILKACQIGLQRPTAKHFCKDLENKILLIKCWTLHCNINGWKCIHLYRVIYRRNKAINGLILLIRCLFYWKVFQGAGLSDTLTFLFLLCRSPTEFTRVLGPRMIRVLWGHCVHTSECSPSRIFRMFSAPVTRMRGLPKRWVLKTFPCFSRLEMWKLDPCYNTTELHVKPFR